MKATSLPNTVGAVVDGMVWPGKVNLLGHVLTVQNFIKRTFNKRGFWGLTLIAARYALLVGNEARKLTSTPDDLGTLICPFYLLLYGVPAHNAPYFLLEPITHIPRLDRAQWYTCCEI